MKCTKILVMLLAVSMLFALAACAPKADPAPAPTVAAPAATPTPAAEPTPEPAPEPTPEATPVATPTPEAKPMPTAITAGTYTGASGGFGGRIEATVTIDEAGKITALELIGDAETANIGGFALPKLKDAFLAAGNAKVDVVSGATLTSNGAIKAVEDALTQGGVDVTK